MAICSSETLKQILEVTDATALDLINRCADAADAAVKKFCGRDFETAAYTEYYDGPGERDLLLKQRPVTAITTVHLDQLGYYGTGSGAFGSTTLLTEGTDFVLMRDQSSTVAGSARLRRLGALAGGTGGEYGWFPAYGEAFGARMGVAGRKAAVWPRGTGNVKVVYTAGFAATAIPEDVRMAADQLAAWLYRNAPMGGLNLQSENYLGYSYALAALGGEPDLGSTRQLLSRHREVRL